MDRHACMSPGGGQAAASILSKVLRPGLILPIGIVTSLIGVPFFFALVFLYMLLSSHTVYREGWFKTLVKSLLVFGSFTFVALCIAFVLIIRLIYTYWE